jgi:hypothetical protein
MTENTMAKIKHATLIEEFEDTDYPFGIFKFFYQCGMLYFGHCVVCPSLIYSFILPIWYFQTFISMGHALFWPLCCLSFFDLQLQITPLVSSNSAVSQKRRENIMAKIKHATLIEEFEDTKWVI